jgi:hypothetical protein
MEALYPHFNIRMGCELGRGFMLILLVALANAAVAPVILPFALWWCIVSWIMWRYVILYVYERSNESGGMVRSQQAQSPRTSSPSFLLNVFLRLFQ